MSKKKKYLKKDNNKKHLELNSKRIRFLSSYSSIYDTSATIIIKGESYNEKQEEENKLSDFLIRAPISFD